MALIQKTFPFEQFDRLQGARKVLQDTSSQPKEMLQVAIAAGLTTPQRMWNTWEEGTRNMGENPGDYGADDLWKCIGSHREFFAEEVDDLLSGTASTPEQAEQLRNDRILGYAGKFRRNMAEGQQPAVTAILQQLDELSPLELMQKLENIGGRGFSVFQGYETVLVCREYSEKLHQPDTELREKMQSFEAQLRNVLPRIRRILEIMRDETLLWDDAMEIEKAEITARNAADSTFKERIPHSVPEPQMT